MGLFDDQSDRFAAKLDELRDKGRLAPIDFDSGDSWQTGREVVLGAHTALELGNPSVGSLLSVFWDERHTSPRFEAFRVGPELCDLQKSGASFGLIVQVFGAFDDPYEQFRDLRFATHRIELAGLMVRSMPSSLSLWCRVSKEAIHRGFSLSHLARTVRKNLADLEFVHGARIVFVVDDPGLIKSLANLADQVDKILGALAKLHEEQIHDDCDKCDFKDICAGLEQLQALREKRLSGRAT